MLGQPDAEMTLVQASDYRGAMRQDLLVRMRRADWAAHQPQSARHPSSPSAT